MGLYLCACQILGWLPPLVFTAMNEGGLSMRLGLASLNIYFLGSLIVYFLVGDYQLAVERAKLTSGGRIQSEGEEIENQNADLTPAPADKVEDTKPDRQEAPAEESVEEAATPTRSGD